MSVYTENAYGYVRVPSQLRGESDVEYAKIKDEIDAHNRAFRKEVRDRKRAEDKELLEYYETRPPGAPGSTRRSPFITVPVRSYHRHPPIHPGDKFSRPADPTDPTSVASPSVTVISRLQFQSALTYFGKNKGDPDFHGTYSNGLWKVECFCGAIYEATTTNLNLLIPAALHCPACTLPRKRRTQNFRTRPGAERHMGRTYGRLTVQEWVQREGWLCLCECGAAEMVRRSVELGNAGMRRCPHV